ncbi:ATP-dependent carboxylate-amine ligase [Nonomuraea sp. FMUSA5-5]|uniref:ATP-dependent carboxylate-amine ligase n=1 Tax=Nonomuraea composti TaxID=2720023 RepID=A0ABX1AVE0_9ACTN|nr:ATP-dependent carboxylate-amine ligase [Nonomuraea sp. FMUSA5-5]NJP89603.1 ATP-dependent carboxylate-amine ligase [Nonomuraea sp. FMUSA5-5]
MLLILSEPGDATVRMVLPKLKARGAEVVWWDPARYPAAAHLTARFKTGGPHLTLVTGGESVDLSGTTAVWYRRPGRPTAAPDVTAGDLRTRVEELSEWFLEGFWDLLDARWLPGRHPVLRRAHNKLVHLALAERLGFAVPPTVITNDPAELAPAYERAGGRLIAKPVEYVPFEIDGARHTVYTTVVQRRDLAGRARLAHEPTILQPYVGKAVELRVTVVGRQVFAAEIASQDSARTRDDWRHYDFDRARHSVHHLPDDVAGRCVDLVAALGVTFGAIDLILTPDGEYVFLEINPNGQWAWIEDLTGLPIGDAIADWLVAGETDL